MRKWGYSLPLKHLLNYNYAQSIKKWNLHCAREQSANCLLSTSREVSSSHTNHASPLIRRVEHICLFRPTEAGISIIRFYRTQPRARHVAIIHIPHTNTSPRGLHLYALAIIMTHLIPIFNPPTAYYYYPFLSHSFPLAFSKYRGVYAGEIYR